MVGWFISLFEMIVAAPLWAAAHLHPQGEGFAGDHGGRGYMMAAEVFARPLFMIFGLLGAMLIMDPLLRIVNGMFMNAAGSVQTDSTTGIPTIIGLVVIYVVVCVTLVHKIFDLIHVLPNTAMRWIGGHASGHDQSGGVQENIRTAFLAAAAATRRALPAGFGLSADNDGNINGSGKRSKSNPTGNGRQTQHAPAGTGYDDSD